MRVPSTMFMGVGLIVGLAVLLLTPLSSSAVTFDLTTGTPAAGFGNSFTITEDGVTATVLGFSAEDTTSDFTAGELNVNSFGVGICNETEGSCDPFRNDVTNNAGRDFVLVEFSTSVFLIEAIINNEEITVIVDDEEIVTGTDSDVSFFAGIGATPDFLNIDPLGASLGPIFSDPQNASVPIPLGSRVIDLASQVPTQVDWLLIGADLTDDSPEDIFRLASVKAVIPEPSTILLFGTGLAGLMLYNRRRKK